MEDKGNGDSDVYDTGFGWEHVQIVVQMKRHKMLISVTRNKAV